MHVVQYKGDRHRDPITLGVQVAIIYALRILLLNNPCMELHLVHRTSSGISSSTWGSRLSALGLCICDYISSTRK